MRFIYAKPLTIVLPLFIFIKFYGKYSCIPCRRIPKNRDFLFKVFNDIIIIIHEYFWKSYNTR